mgnify:CR=1 FL=1
MNPPNRKLKVGELRPSQLLYTYGVGAVVDLPHISAMIMGLDDWHAEQCGVVAEDRLLADVRRILGAQVERLVSPPVPLEENVGFFTPSDVRSVAGVPVAPFPRWLRCSACNLLAPLSSGLLQLQDVPGRPDLARYFHRNCNRAAKPTALPARFLVACPQGHLDDFPWLWFVHRGPDPCHGPLELRELGVSGEALDVEVRCRGCDKPPRRMSDAFGEQAERRLPRCRGRRPQLRDFEDDGCKQTARTILLGASNSWFSFTRSILHIPTASDDVLLRLVERHWSVLVDVTDRAVLAFLRKRGELSAFHDASDDALWNAIDRFRSRGDATDRPPDLKGPEWSALERMDARQQTADFKLREGVVPARWRPWIDRVLLVDRMREVTALLGFSRLRPPQDLASEDDTTQAQYAPLARRAPNFVPAAEIRGEGLFLRFSEARVRAWCDAMHDLDEEFHGAHTAWRKRRRHPFPRSGYPGARYILLHSFAHALMRELSLECGYAAASLRERIYAREPNEPFGAMAGILIYTAAPDAEGTLGGLVRRGHPDELDAHIERVLHDARTCSSDPLCADHRPEPDGTTLHGAACHACLFAPETSCERGNRYLDRSTLVRTIGSHTFPFFEPG